MYIHKIVFLYNINCSIIISFARRFANFMSMLFLKWNKTWKHTQRRRKKRREDEKKTIDMKHEDKIGKTQKDYKMNFACTLESFSQNFSSTSFAGFVCRQIELIWAQTKLFQSVNRKSIQCILQHNITINVHEIHMYAIRMLYEFAFVYVSSRIEHTTIWCSRISITFYLSNFQLKHAFNFYKLNCLINELSDSFVASAWQYAI